MASEYESIQQEGWNPKEIIEEIREYSLKRFPNLNWDKVYIQNIDDYKIILTQGSDEETEKMLHTVYQELLRNQKLTKSHARRGL
jgi:hypothetical protein